MEDEDVSVLKEVRREVIELRQLGEQWGLTSVEINSCIDSAFKTRLEIGITEKIAKKLQSQTKWSKIRFAFRVWLAFVILMSGFTLMITQTDYISKAVGKVLQPYGYQIFRVIRLASLPLHARYNISTYHNEECLIGNPYFEEEAADCFLCEGIDSVRLTKLKREKQLDENLFQKPILFRGLQNQIISVMDIANLINREELLQDSSLAVYSSVDWVKSLNDLNSPGILEDITNDKDFHIKWISRRMGTSQFLKRLFPRPCVFPKKFEVVIEKFLFISGPGSEGESLTGEARSRDLFYIQGTGSRTLLFTPRAGCEQSCSSFQVKTEPGDVLCFPYAWHVSLLPNEDEVSVSFLGGIA
ncbi:hypothetical protein SNE40_006426 [Patella caerulea]|uniref:Uncharacterized protein n=1 Tax=Patella caerulea TaxID=87958 RepID=A0AAN8JWI7_PATCE